MICPKCHGQFGNPNYFKDSLGREWLERRCHTCGYATRNPTADAKPLSDLDRQFMRIMTETTGCKFVDVTPDSKDQTS